MRENVEKALEKIRPALQSDGGDIELVDVVDGVVKVQIDWSMRWVSDVPDDPEDGSREKPWNTRSGG